MDETKPPPFGKLNLLPAYKIVSNEIERRILAGQFKPGDQLPSETALAQQFGVNRSTVREGIRQLEQEGLVTRGGKRLIVSLPRYSDLAPRATRALIMQEVTFRELWDVARTLEPLAARLAAGPITDDEIDRIGANVDATEDALRAGASLVEFDIQFHTLIAEAARNRALLLAREPISLLFYPAVEVMMPRLPQSGPRLMSAHRTILEALRRRDGGTAELWMGKHIDDFKRGYEVARLDMGRSVSAPLKEEVEA